MGSDVFSKVCPFGFGKRGGAGMIFVNKITRPAFLWQNLYTKRAYIATMASLRQHSVNASKWKIYDKNAEMLQNNIHDTQITIGTISYPLHAAEEGKVTLVGSCNKVPPVARMSSQKMDMCNAKETCSRLVG